MKLEDIQYRRWMAERLGARRSSSVRQQSSQSVVPDCPLINDRRLRKVKALIDTASLHISLSDAARAAGLEEHYFSAYFKRRIGTTFSRWRRTHKVLRAIALMRDLNLSVTSAAICVGYSDVTSLERACRAVVGLTPRQAAKKERRSRS